MNETVVVAGELGSRVVEYLAEEIPGFAALNPWMSFAVMVVAAIALSQAVALLFRAVVKGATSRTKTTGDDILVDRLQQPVAWLLFSALIYLAFARLSFSPAVAVFIRGTLVTFNIAIVAWLLARFSDALFTIWDEHVASRTESILDDTMLPILSKFVAVTIWIVAFILALSAFGVEVGPFLAGLGIAGIAIGFAVKDSLGNVFGGISLALDGAYKVGDKVKLADGLVGVVHDVSLRSTRVETYDGDLVMVPNGKISVENIYTYAQPARKSRVQVDFGVEYGSDVDKACEVVEKTVKKIDDVLKDPAVKCHFMRMGDFALEMRVYFWVADYQQAWGAQRAATRAIYNALNKSKIGIPFPTQTIHVKK